ncbi:hypothetical protein Ga0100231_018085 [Opitutaceae bacterium TAV4]|nr:hypothetical protein Ga0100231_017775 [Opitutaceae bacterium TAV4]RRJ95890.1 hypothetical protein Ga0100231_018085 [Opitutaceae bacterium TAV4]RRK00042.1 hypothetical protein Ga0100230_018765 [Opitutaceae bacterium TAV3]
MKINYILFDWENVQPDISLLPEQEHFKVICFLGESQKKVPADLVLALQKKGEHAQYVRIKGNGKNALDFHIAFKIGQLSQSTPDSYFHIISKDEGFDPLIQYLKDQKIFAARHACLSEIPLLKRTPKERAEYIGERLKKISRPAKIKTLSSTINAFFTKQLSDTELTAIISELEKTGIIKIQDQNVTYPSR